MNITHSTTVNVQEAAEVNADAETQPMALLASADAAADGVAGIATRTDASAAVPEANGSPSALAGLIPDTAAEDADAAQGGKYPGLEEPVAAVTSAEGIPTAQGETSAAAEAATEAGEGTHAAEGDERRAGSMEVDLDLSQPEEPGDAANDRAVVEAHDTQDAQLESTAGQDDAASAEDGVPIPADGAPAGGDGATDVGAADPAVGKEDPAGPLPASQHSKKRKKGRLTAAAAAAPRRQTRGSALADPVLVPKAEEAADADESQADDGTTGGDEKPDEKEPEATAAPMEIGQEAAAEADPQVIHEAGQAAAEAIAANEDGVAGTEEQQDGAEHEREGAKLTPQETTMRRGHDRE